MTTLTLKDLLSFVSYGVQLQILVTERTSEIGAKRYEYLFNSSDLITREDIEKCYPELLNKELSDGIHGEGIRDGIYIHLYK